MELYTCASSYAHVANSRWFADVSGSHIAKVALMLPAEVAEAARLRGRSRNLWTSAQEALLMNSQIQVSLIPG